MQKDEIKKMVRRGYAKIAKRKISCCNGISPCCGTSDNMAESISKNIGYENEDISSVPAGANLGLGCGNPVALAFLKNGETVLDLGAGAGFDCFLAAKKVGATGIVIGVDMTEEMVEKARKNAKKGNYKNVEFRFGEIEDLPVDDNSVDAVISNCVINLSPEKEKVFAESFRVLKKNGRLMVSDLVLLKNLPEKVKKSVEAYIGCLAGAVLKTEYIEAIKKAGFKNIKVIEETHYPIELIADKSSTKEFALNFKIDLQTIKDIADSVVSIKISAVKL